MNAKRILLGTLLWAFVATGSAFAQAKQIKMTYAHSENPSSTVAAVAFKTMVEGQSAGQIKVNLVIHGTLGSDRDVVDQLKLGELEFYVPGVHGLSAVAPNFQMFDAPYLFADRREFYELMQDRNLVGYLNDHLLKKSGNTIRFLGAAENSVRNLYSKTGPLRQPSDLKSVKLRVPPGPLNIAVWQGLGIGSVVGLSGSERNQGLQTGIINATEGSLSGALESGHLNILPHITMTGHSYSYMAYLVNERFWKSLSANHQAILQMSADLAITIQNGSSMDEEFKALNASAAKGNIVTILSPAEAATWQRVAFPVGQKFIADNLEADFAARVQSSLSAVRARHAKK